MQVIIYTNENGGVSLTIPTGEISIEQVLVKDCPIGAIIVDDSKLPSDHTYFNAWELVDGTVVVNEAKKQSIITAQEAQATAKQSALAKLTALGLTQAEVTALLG